MNCHEKYYSGTHGGGWRFWEFPRRTRAIGWMASGAAESRGLRYRAIGGGRDAKVAVKADTDVKQTKIASGSTQLVRRQASFSLEGDRLVC